MTHDEILKAARERIATITAEVAKLEAEKLKLRVLVGDFPQPAIAPLPPMMPQPFQPWPPLTEVRWTTGTGSVSITPVVWTPVRPNTEWPLYESGSLTIPCGGGVRFDPSVRYTVS